MNAAPAATATMPAASPAPATGNELGSAATIALVTIAVVLAAVAWALLAWGWRRTQ